MSKFFGNKLLAPTLAPPKSNLSPPKGSLSPSKNLAPSTTLSIPTLSNRSKLTIPSIVITTNIKEKDKKPAENELNIAVISNKKGIQTQTQAKPKQNTALLSLNTLVTSSNSSNNQNTSPGGNHSPRSNNMDSSGIELSPNSKKPNYLMKSVFNVSLSPTPERNKEKKNSYLRLTPIQQYFNNDPSPKANDNSFYEAGKTPERGEHNHSFISNENHNRSFNYYNGNENELTHHLGYDFIFQKEFDKDKPENEEKDDDISDLKSNEPNEKKPNNNSNSFIVDDDYYENNLLFDDVHNKFDNLNIQQKPESQRALSIANDDNNTNMNLPQNQFSIDLFKNNTTNNTSNSNLFSINSNHNINNNKIFKNEHIPQHNELLNNKGFNNIMDQQFNNMQQQQQNMKKKRNQQLPTINNTNINFNINTINLNANNQHIFQQPQQFNMQSQLNNMAQQNQNNLMFNNNYSFTNQYQQPQQFQYGNYQNNYSPQKLMFHQPQVQFNQQLLNTPNQNMNQQLQPTIQLNLAQNPNMIQPKTQNPSSKGGRRGFNITTLINMDNNEIIKQSHNLAKDQIGCRFLQKKIEEDTQFALNSIYPIILDHLLDTVNDQFGNYLIQKFFDYLNEEQLQLFLRMISPSFTQIGLNQYGTRVIQKMSDAIYNNVPSLIPPFQNLISSNVIVFSNDLNGCHIIQKLLLRKSIDNNFVYKAMSENIEQIANHKNGCCFLQKCIEKLKDIDLEKLLNAINHKAKDLIIDQYGNYVIQHVMKINGNERNFNIFNIIMENIVFFSNQKFSSNVIERFFGFENTKKAIIEKLLIPQIMKDILLDSYGNYVVQKALANANQEYQFKLLLTMAPLMDELKTLTFGSKLHHKLTIQYPMLMYIMGMQGNNSNINMNHNLGQ